MLDFLGIIGRRRNVIPHLPLVSPKSNRTLLLGVAQLERDGLALRRHDADGAEVRGELRREVGEDGMLAVKAELRVVQISAQLLHILLDRVHRGGARR